MTLGDSVETALNFVCECEFDTETIYLIESGGGLFLGYTGDFYQVLYGTKNPVTSEQWVLVDDFVGWNGEMFVVIMHQISGRYLTVNDGKIFSVEEIDEGCFWQFYETDVVENRNNGRMVFGDL